MFFLFLSETWGRRISAGGMIDERTDGQLNVRLEMPPFVRAGDTAVLRCKYDLGTDPLYQVKWYKGSKEFYRYTPKESPSTKSFPLVGIQIDVSPTCCVCIFQKFDFLPKNCLILLL